MGKRIRICPEHLDELKPRDTSHGRIYVCPRGDCTVAQWDGDEPPVPADKKTRFLRKKCHEFFDPLWRGDVFDTREDAYGWLASVLEIPREDAHMRLFNRDRAERALQHIQDLRERVLG